MAPPVGAERWLGIRALREGEPPTFERLAAASGLHPVTIRQRALQEGWKKRRLPRAGSRAALAAAASLDEPEAGGDVTAEAAKAAEVPLEALRQRLAAILPRQLGRIVVLAERGRIDKAQLDALLASVRVLERLGALAAEQTPEEQRRSDDELAATLRTIDDRIVELAYAHARRLGTREDREQVD